MLRDSHIKVFYLRTFYVMKNFIKFWFVCLFICWISLIWFSFWFQHEKFSSYKEKSNWISFICQKQCIITLWYKDDIDFINLKWLVNWSGDVYYGVLIWNRITPLYQYELSSQIDELLDSAKYKRYLRMYPQNTKFVLLFKWDIGWYLDIQVWKFSLWQKIVQSRKNFWEVEYIYQMSMNSRNGILIRWQWILTYWYRIFIISSIVIIVFVKWKNHNKYRIIFYIWLWLFLFIWVRNTVTYTYILNEWISGFKTNRELFDLGDFIPFMEKVRDKLNLNFEENGHLDCKIYMEPYDNRNINDHWWFYFKPCTTWDMADYKIYYKTSIPDKDSDKKVLVNFSGSYLLDNKSK